MADEDKEEKPFPPPNAEVWDNFIAQIDSEATAGPFLPGDISPIQGHGERLPRFAVRDRLRSLAVRCKARDVDANALGDILRLEGPASGLPLHDILFLKHAAEDIKAIEKEAVSRFQIPTPEGEAA